MEPNYVVGGGNNFILRQSTRRLVVNPSSLKGGGSLGLSDNQAVEVKEVIWGSKSFNRCSDADTLLPNNKV